MVYIDEAQEHFDEHVETLLAQARKYNVAMHLAHQTLGQLTLRLKGIMMANTSVKCVGGVSAQDAKEFANEMQTSTDYIRGAKKRDGYAEFALWLKNVSEETQRISVPFGVLERQDTFSDNAFQSLIDQNRERYASSESERSVASSNSKADDTPKSSPVPPPEEQTPKASQPSVDDVLEQSVVLDGTSEDEVLQEATPPEKTLSGRDGEQHKYLQQLVKVNAEAQGFGARIEETIPDGKGRVDVLLTQSGVTLAVEISVTTSSEHEYQNIHKCLGAGYDTVVLLCADDQALARHQSYCTERFESDSEKNKVRLYSPEQFIEYLEIAKVCAPMKEETIRGYRVKTNYSMLSEEEKQRRKEAIARVVADSIKKLKPNS